MLHLQNPRRQLRRRITWKHRNTGLADDGALIDTLADKVHAGAMRLYSCLQSPFMGV